MHIKENRFSLTLNSYIRKYIVLILLTLARSKRNIPDLSIAAYVSSVWSYYIKNNEKKPVRYGSIPLPPTRNKLSKHATYIYVDM